MNKRRPEGLRNLPRITQQISVKQRYRFRGKINHFVCQTSTKSYITNSRSPTREAPAAARGPDWALYLRAVPSPHPLPWAFPGPHPRPSLLWCFSLFLWWSLPNRLRRQSSYSVQMLLAPCPQCTVNCTQNLGVPPLPSPLWSLGKRYTQRKWFPDFLRMSERAMSPQQHHKWEEIRHRMAPDWTAT